MTVKNNISGAVTDSSEITKKHQSLNSFPKYKDREIRLEPEIIKIRSEIAKGLLEARKLKSGVLGFFDNQKKASARGQERLGKIKSTGQYKEVSANKKNVLTGVIQLGDEPHLYDGLTSITVGGIPQEKFSKGSNVWVQKTISKFAQGELVEGTSIQNGVPQRGIYFFCTKTGSINRICDITTPIKIIETGVDGVQFLKVGDALLPSNQIDRIDYCCLLEYYALGYGEIKRKGLGYNTIYMSDYEDGKFSLIFNSRSSSYKVLKDPLNKKTTPWELNNRIFVTNIRSNKILDVIKTDEGERIYHGIVINDALVRTKIPFISSDDYKVLEVSNITSRDTDGYPSKATFDGIEFEISKKNNFEIKVFNLDGNKLFLKSTSVGKKGDQIYHCIDRYKKNVDLYQPKNGKLTELRSNIAKKSIHQNATLSLTHEFQGGSIREKVTGMYSRRSGAYRHSQSHLLDPEDLSMVYMCSISGNSIEVIASELLEQDYKTKFYSSDQSIKGAIEIIHDPLNIKKLINVYDKYYASMINLTGKSNFRSLELKEVIVSEKILKFGESGITVLAHSDNFADLMQYDGLYVKEINSGKSEIVVYTKDMGTYTHRVDKNTLDKLLVKYGY